MKNMTLTNIAQACGGRLICPGEPPAAEAAGVVIDSRKAGKDFLFIATKGERVDGHRFIPEVFAGGALGGIAAGLLLRRLSAVWLHRALGALIVWGGLRLLLR